MHECVCVCVCGVVYMVLPTFMINSISGTSNLLVPFVVSCCDCVSTSAADMLLLVFSSAFNAFAKLAVWWQEVFLVAFFALSLAA